MIKCFFCLPGGQWERSSLCSLSLQAGALPLNAISTPSKHCDTPRPLQHTTISKILSQSWHRPVHLAALNSRLFLDSTACESLGVYIENKSRWLFPLPAAKAAQEKAVAGRLLWALSVPQRGPARVSSGGLRPVPWELCSLVTAGRNHMDRSPLLVSGTKEVLSPLQAQYSSHTDRSEL